jgi:hypothetical protein
LQIYGEWRNPAFRRCYRKAAYSTWQKAQEKAKKASIRTGDFIVAYQCCECGKFHIGHEDQSQKRIREEQLATVSTRCTRCGDPVDIARRHKAAESGATTVFCSRNCRERFGEKKGRAKRPASDADVE